MEMKFYKKFLFMLMITCIFCSISSISFADNTTPSAITTSSSSIDINDDRGEERAKPAPIIDPNNDLDFKEDKKEESNIDVVEPIPTPLGPVVEPQKPTDKKKAPIAEKVDLNIVLPTGTASLPKTGEGAPFMNYVLSIISLSAAYFLLRKK